MLTEKPTCCVFLTCSSVCFVKCWDQSGRTWKDVGTTESKGEKQTEFYMSHPALWEQILLYLLDFVQKLALMKGPTQSDAEINGRDQCRTVCRLIFRGDPCTILGSDIISVSNVGPQIPIRDEKPRQSAM